MRLARRAIWALTAVTSFQVNAADSGFYFGISGGRAKYDFDKLQVPVATFVPGGGVGLNPGTPVPSLRFTTIPPEAIFVAVSSYSAPFAAISPFAVTTVEHEEEDTSWSALVGYRISRYVAAEVSYTNLGELTAWTSVYTYPTFAPIPFKHTLETQGPTLTLLGILPVNESWDIYARAGAFFLDSKLQSTIGASRRSTSFGSDGVVFGLGAQFIFGEHWSVRLDVRRYDGVGNELEAGKADIDNASLGVLYRL